MVKPWIKLLRAAGEHILLTRLSVAAGEHRGSQSLPASTEALSRCRRAQRLSVAVGEHRDSQSLPASTEALSRCRRAQRLSVAAGEPRCSQSLDLGRKEADRSSNVGIFLRLNWRSFMCRLKPVSLRNLVMSVCSRHSPVLFILAAHRVM